MSVRKITPKITAKNADDIIVTDELGRVIVWRKLDLLQKARVAKAIGHNESSEYDMYAKVSAGVRSINGVPKGIPVTLQAVEQAIADLKDEGFWALDAAMRERFVPQSPEEHREEVGESLGSPDSE
jgi:hypothetical protein